MGSGPCLLRTNRTHQLRNAHLGESVRPEQSVQEMVEEVLQRQAKVVLERSGCSPQQALEAVLQTDAGRQLSGLRGGPRAQEEKARGWQEGLLRERTLERLEGVVALDAAAAGRFRFGTERHYTRGLRTTWSG
jgi:hypothetical protein